MRRKVGNPHESFSYQPSTFGLSLQGEGGTVLALLAAVRVYFAAAFHASADEYRLCFVRARQLSQALDRLRRAESRFGERQHPIS